MILKKSVLVNSKILLSYGVNKKTLVKSYKKIGINSRPNELFLKNKQKSKVYKYLKKKLTGKELKNKIHDFEIFYKKILLDKNKH